MPGCATPINQINPNATDPTERTWATNILEVQAHLDAHTIDVDGDTYIDPTAADPALVDLHATLTTVGYAHGWIRKP